MEGKVRVLVRCGGRYVSLLRGGGKTLDIRIRKVSSSDRDLSISYAGVDLIAQKAVEGDQRKRLGLGVMEDEDGKTEEENAKKYDRRA